MFRASRTDLKAVFMRLFGAEFRRTIRPARRFVAHILVWLPMGVRFIFHTSVRPVQGSHRPRLIDRRYFVVGIPVWSRRERRNKYRIALLVDEFFGAWRTAIGGYGALARKFVCRFVPDEEIQIDVLLNTYGMWRTAKKIVDQTAIYKLSINPRERQQWLDQQGYDLFLSIEMTAESFLLVSRYKSDTPLLYWIQAPIDLELYQSRLRSVSIVRDIDWSYLSEVATWIQNLMKQGRVHFISQGKTLTAIARKLYQVPESTPIADLPNPIEIDFGYNLDDPPKQNKIIFLGRLEAIKRTWIICEVAKRLPQYEFYLLGATGRGRNQEGNAKALHPYRFPDGSSRISNLHFTGHVDGEEKARHIKTAKLIMNTSLWEGIPISWLEALSFGTLIVSTLDRDEIAERFGTYVGEVIGDGTKEEDLNKLADAIVYWMEHDEERQATAQRAIDFIRGRHSIPAFQEAMRAEILARIP